MVTDVPVVTRERYEDLVNVLEDRRDAAAPLGTMARNEPVNEPAAHDRGGPREDRLVHRPTTALRPHPIYRELCGPIAATRVSRVGRQAGVMREPVSITTDGTILDGYVRWHVAMERHQPRLPCIEYDLTDEEALQFLLARHHATDGFNAFCRILVALRLEPYYRARAARRQPGGRRQTPASNLTNADRVDVRAEIARVAGVATGNVTKVRQLLPTVIPAVRDQLRQGTVRIHRAWQWRNLSVQQQRNALWEHLHRNAIKNTVRRLVRAHADSSAPAQPIDVAVTVLGGLAMYDPADLTVAIVDVPGRAVVVTRACYDDLQEKYTR